MSPVRVLLVDDHPVVRDGIRSLIDKSVDIEMIGEAATGAEALQAIEHDPPDVVLLDLELPDIPGVQVARRVQERYPGVKILVLSAHDDPVYVRELLELGAAGYLMKEEAPGSIVEAVRGVAHGEQGWVSRRIAAQMASWMQNNETEASLTVREYEVLRWLVLGKTNQAIAQEMNISVKTVEKYIRNIFTKLNVSSRVEAAVHAIKAGLVKS